MAENGAAAGFRKNRDFSSPVDFAEYGVSGLNTDEPGQNSTPRKRPVNPRSMQVA
jgi:hypothetical protein